MVKALCRLVLRPSLFLCAKKRVVCWVLIYLWQYRGEIRGGRFVRGFLGEQFAWPYAVESLRAMRKQLESEQSISLSAVDPLNLTGIVLAGERMPAIPGKTIAILIP